MEENGGSKSPSALHHQPSFLTYKLTLLATISLILSRSWSVMGEHPSRFSNTNNKTLKIQDMIFMNSGWSSLLEIKNEFGISKSKVIPNHHYVSSFLNVGFTRRFLYFNENGGNILSIIVTPCTSPLLWHVKFWPVTNATSNLLPPSQLLKSFRTERSATFYDLNSRRGIYGVEIKTLHSDSYVHLYAFSGSEPVRIPSNFIEISDINPGVPKPRVSVRRLRGDRLQVKWEASSRNPHLMKYCIVVNSHRDYSSLCAAQGVKYGVLPPDLLHVSYYYFPVHKSQANSNNNNNNFFSNSYSGSSSGLDESKQRNNNMRVLMDYPPQETSNRIFEGPTRHHPSQSSSSSTALGAGSYEQRERSKDIIIGCVNKKTNYILHNLQEGKLYYFNVFVKDSSTNLTYPYVRTTLKYRTPKHLPNGITDSKAKKLRIAAGNPTLVKFNLKKPCSELTMYVMPCGGGAIKYQLIHAYKSIIESEIVDSLDILKIAVPQKGRYYIRLRQSPTLNSSHPLMVEIYVSKKNKRFPLPKLPYDTQIREDLNSRGCDSVNILWQPSPDPKDNEYCIFLKEESRKRKFNFKKPNQCDVERSLNSDPYVTHSLCIQKSPRSSGEDLSQRIDGLEPGKMYVVQIIVRRHKGKALSYDLFQLSTLSQCPDLDSPSL